MKLLRNSKSQHDRVLTAIMTFEWFTSCHKLIHQGTLQDYFQSSTYLAVSKEYYGGVDRDVIRKLYKRLVWFIPCKNL